MKECTFQPNTSRAIQTRTLEQFLDDQVKFQEKRRDGITKLAEDKLYKEEKAIGFKPTINENSRIMAEQKKRDKKSSFIKGTQDEVRTEVPQSFVKTKEVKIMIINKLG
jgi:cell fate (sporulation/competence/biofilm development) regulator YlbF (YheA/YmcA/DUF963 family)